MGVISIVLLVLFIVAAALLILIVLVQDDQGEGIGGLFGGSSASFGPRTGNILTRFTTILAMVFMIGAFALAWLNRTPELGDVVSKARLESLRASEDSSWWVESGEVVSGEAEEATVESDGSDGEDSTGEQSESE